MDKNEIPLAIFLDLSKAFDTIDHKILLHKFSHYGIKDRSLKLLESYLENRKQYLTLNDTNSCLLPITTGVPQGSILGPLFFIIYINDLHFACDNLHPIIYADDTSLSAALRTFGNAGQDRNRNINLELQNISDWLRLNKLSLNPLKTKAMLFHTPRRKVLIPEIFINETPIKFVDTFDYLGIEIDKHLNWKAHIRKITIKMSKVTGVMCRMKNIFSQEVLLTLYNSLFLPYLNYGMLSWKSKLKEVIKLQKKVVRIISGARYNAHTEPIFKKLNLLKVSDLYLLHAYKFCYKLENNVLPLYFHANLFTKNSTIHRHNTRTSSAFHLPLVKHEFAKNSIQYIIPLAFNDCPYQIKSKIYTHSLHGFIMYIKRFFNVSYSETCSIPNCYVCQL